LIHGFQPNKLTLVGQRLLCKPEKLLRVFTVGYDGGKSEDEWKNDVFISEDVSSSSEQFALTKQLLSEFSVRTDLYVHFSL